MSGTTGEIDSAQEQPRVQRLWLVRHGVTEWNIEQRLCGHHDVALSPLGRKQAAVVAHHLKATAISAIFSSDLARARETAAILAQQLALPAPMTLSTNWREMSFGDWEGLTYGQIVAQQQGRPDFFSDPLHHAPPNGEALPDLMKRVRAGFAQLVAAAGDATREQGDIVLVSHGGALRVLLCLVLGMPLERQWQLRIDHGSLSAIDFLPGAEEPLLTATLALFNVQSLSQDGQRDGALHHV